MTDSSADFDLVIRGGTVIDGTGGPPRVGDVAIRNKVIVAVGEVRARGKEEIDARDKLVTPGVVDIHTHYDGQVTWNQRLHPSSLHGVTTVVMGNCGVGVAPSPTQHQAQHQAQGMCAPSVADELPQPILSAGVDFRWQSFPDYLQILSREHFDIDVATQIPHAALRVHVMGERALRGHRATETEIARMAQLALDGVFAGALGFSTSSRILPRDDSAPYRSTLVAAEAELMSIAVALGDMRSGVLQVDSDFADLEAEFSMLRRIAERARRPISVSLAQHDRAPQAYRALLQRISEANRAGLPIKAQVCGRGAGLVLGLQTRFCPFSNHPAYREIASLPLAERIERLQSPSWQAALCAPFAAPRSGFEALLCDYRKMFVLGDPPDYEPPAELSIAQIAARTGKPAALVALDALLAQQGHGLLYVPHQNYSNGDLEAAREMLQHPDSVCGLGAGGAPMGLVSDGSEPTHMLSHWTRDRTRGPLLSLPFVIKSQCADTAATVGLFDRGVLARGYKADLNVIDYDALCLGKPEVVSDLPSGRPRLLQRARGYDATVVSGQVVYRKGEATAALPGRLVRGSQTSWLAAAE